MKRVKAACLQQVLHFFPKEGTPPQMTEKAVEEEIAQYKLRMDRARTQYRILRQETQPDGSVVLEIKKQYNTSPTGNFLD